jgi:hypothetical protein
MSLFISLLLEGFVAGNLVGRRRRLQGQEDLGVVLRGLRAVAEHDRAPGAAVGAGDGDDGQHVVGVGHPFGPPQAGYRDRRRVALGTAGEAQQAPAGAGGELSSVAGGLEPGDDLAQGGRIGCALVDGRSLGRGPGLAVAVRRFAARGHG